MSKILIMADFYYPKPLANGICIHEIAISLKEKGYEVHVVCYGEKTEEFMHEYEGIHIHSVKYRLFYRLRSYGEANIDNWKGNLAYKSAIFINKFKKLLFSAVYPLTSPIFLLRYYKQIKRLHRTNNFNIMLSVFNPLEALISGMFMKKKDSSIKLGVYVLDSLTNGAKRKYIPKSWTENKGWKWEEKVFRYADKIFNMKTHEKHLNKNRYDKYQYKMEIVDIPLFKQLKENNNQPDMNFDKENKDSIDLIYTGGLTLNGRNPEYLCKVFLRLRENNNCKLHFYSRGNAETVIEKYQRLSSGGIIRYGYVERERAVNAILSSDVLVSIGNDGSDMIPSKIFEYMATGKKIIHFYKSPNDSCLVYYTDYPNSLLINENDSLDENSKKIESFLYSPKSDFSYEKFKETFKKNTPEYTAELICSMNEL